MNWARRRFVGLLGIVLLFCLVGTAYAVSLNRTLGTPEKPKKLLADSGIYDKVVNSVLEKSEDEAGQGQGDISIPYTDQAVKDAANQTFTPQQLQASAETFIDANYKWLSGESQQPVFSIDLTTTKQDFGQRVGQYVTQRLEGLAVCTAEQQAQLQIPVNPLLAACRPAGLDPKTEGARVTEEISRGNFLANSVIDPNSVGKDKDSTEEPYYKQLSSLPTLFQLGQKAPLILGLLAIVSAIGGILLAEERLRGLRKVAIMLIVAGVLLIGTKLVADFITSKFDDKLLLSSAAATGELDQSRDNFLGQVASQLTQTNMIFGVVFLLLGVGALIYLFKNRDVAGRPKKPKLVEESFVPVQNTSNPAIINNKPRVRPEASQPARPQSSGDVRDRLRQPGGPPELPSQPKPRKKPPRLIQ